MRPRFVECSGGRHCCGSGGRYHDVMGCGAEGDDERNNVSYGFHVDAVRCIGCRACVDACPEDALHFGEIGDLQAAYGELASIPPLPPADATYPSLVLTAPPALLSALR